MLLVHYIALVLYRAACRVWDVLKSIDLNDLE